MFYERLKAICDSKNTTITAVVKAVSGSTGSVDGWKKGRAPSSDIVVRMAKYLDVTTDFLLGLCDNPTHEKLNLTQNETILITSLREVDPNIRDVVFKMAAVLSPNTSTNDIFLSSNDGISNHEEKTTSAEVRKIRKPVEGEAAAGMPITAVRTEDSFVSVPEKYLDERFFIVRANGHSMEETIPDGAYCVFQRDAFVDDGSIALVQIDGATDQPDDTIKRVYRHGKQVELRSDNSAYAPMFYSWDAVQVAGILVDVLAGDGIV